MANISALGNQIHINQNVNMIANKFINSHARCVSQEMVNSDNFEANHKRLKDTREMEESEAIDEHLNDSEVYSEKPIFRKRGQSEEHKKNPYIINDKIKKIDITI